jgi:hypothetical protein
MDAAGVACGSLSIGERFSTIGSATATASSAFGTRRVRGARVFGAGFSVTSGVSTTSSSADKLCTSRKW